MLRMCNRGKRLGSFMTRRTILKTIFRSLVIGAAAIYFVIDALFLALLRPLARQITSLKLFQSIAPWIGSLGPYPTLGLFVIPLVLLEPIKPFSAYLGTSYSACCSLPLAKSSRLRL